MYSVFSMNKSYNNDDDDDDDDDNYGFSDNKYDIWSLYI